MKNQDGNYLNLTEQEAYGLYITGVPVTITDSYFTRTDGNEMIVETVPYYMIPSVNEWKPKADESVVLETPEGTQFCRSSWYVNAEDITWH